MADYDYITTRGIIIPDTSQIRDDVEEEYKAIFGDDFITDPETPQGRLIEAEVTSRRSVVNNNAKLANQINPNYSGGVFFDAVWSIFGGTRKPEQSSLVTLDMTGIQGTFIPALSTAIDDDGNVWELVADVTLDSSGLASAIFRAQEPGPITASPGTITTIDSGVLGWETVNNPGAATAGSFTQSDARAKQQRRDQLALLGQNTALAVQSNLANIDGYVSHAFRENYENTPQIIDGANLVANSIWVTVDGGTDQDVAQALYESKGAGCNFNGDVLVGVTDDVSGQTQVVKFFRPEEVGIICRITVRARVGVEPTADIIQAIIDYKNGEIEGEEGFFVGRDVSAFEIGSAVNDQIPDITVRQVEIAYKGPSPVFQCDPLSIAISQKPTLLTGDIQVIIQ